MCCDEIVIHDSCAYLCLRMVAALPQTPCCYDTNLKDFDWKKGTPLAPSTASKLETINSHIFGGILY